MNDKSNSLTSASWLEILQKIRARTPARIFIDRGSSYPTRVELELRMAHANAVDAVWTEFHLEHDFPPGFVAQWELFQVSSQAGSKSEFLLNPNLGRRLNDAARPLVAGRCIRAPDLQIVIGDGLSGTAVSRQVPELFPILQQQATTRGWTLGQSFVVQRCRVGIMNDIGDLLAPRVLVLLIGERPGLATAESLSAYMAYDPRSGHTDANRNLISNIHDRGIPAKHAANLIAHLASRLMELRLSGTTVKQDPEPPAISS